MECESFWQAAVFKTKCLIFPFYKHWITLLIELSVFRRKTVNVVILTKSITHKVILSLIKFGLIIFHWYDRNLNLILINETLSYEKHPLLFIISSRRSHIFMIYRYWASCFRYSIQIWVSMSGQLCLCIECIFKWPDTVSYPWSL